jgi:hypothetical protein
MSTAITLLLEIIRHCNGYEDIMDAILTGFSSVISTAKLPLHRVKWRHKLILVKSIIHDWNVVKNPCSRDIMLKYARMTRLGSRCFSTYVSGVSCLHTRASQCRSPPKNGSTLKHTRKIDFGGLSSWDIYLLLSHLLLHQSAAITAYLSQLHLAMR